MKQYTSAQEAQADVGTSPVSSMAHFPEGNAARAEQLGLQSQGGEMACGEEAEQGTGGQGSQGPARSESSAGEDQAPAPEAEEGGFEAQHSSPDHIKIGGEEKVEVAPHTLTVGELNALADYVEDVSELKEIKVDVLTKALVLIRRHDHHHGGLSPEESEWLKGVFRKYEELAKANDAHFAPPSGLDPTGTADHASQMMLHFGKAFDLVHGDSDLEESERTEAARAEAAFGSHYIADAFSAGHLFNKAELMARADEFLDQGLNDHLTFLMAAEATHKKAAATLSQWEVAKREQKGVRSEVGWGPIRAGHLFILLEGMYLGGMEDMIYNGYVRAVHDRIGSQGVEVQSPHQATWVMGGDEHLDATSMAAAQTAVAVAMDLIEAEAEAPGSMSKTELFDTILSHYPTPTEQGQATIDGTIDGVFESTVEAATALAEASTAEMETILRGVQKEAGRFGDLLLRRVGSDEEEEQDPSAPEQGDCLSEYPVVDVRKALDGASITDVDVDAILERLGKEPEEKVLSSYGIELEDALAELGGGVG